MCKSVCAQTCASHVYTFTYIHKCSYINTCMYIYICTCIYIHLHTFTSIYIHLHTFYIYMYILPLPLHLHTYLPSIHTYIHVYMIIYTPDFTCLIPFELKLLKGRPCDPYRSFLIFYRQCFWVLFYDGRMLIILIIVGHHKNALAFCSKIWWIW